jgi:hypothetical protein
LCHDNADDARGILLRNHAGGRHRGCKYHTARLVNYQNAMLLLLATSVIFSAHLTVVYVNTSTVIPTQAGTPSYLPPQAEGGDIRLRGNDGKLIAFCLQSRHWG